MRRYMMYCVGFIMVIMTSNIYAFFDPIEYANYLQDFQAQINTMQSAARELVAIRNQAKNLGKLSEYQWQDVTQILDRMSTTLQQGQAVSAAMSDVDAAFRQRYPDYTKTHDGAVDYQKAYQQWNATTLDTLRNSLSSAAIDTHELKNEQAVMRRLKAQGSSATGRMQVLQVATEIAGENVNQLLQLRQLMMTQMSAQNAYMAYRVSKDAYHEHQLENLISPLDTHFPQYHDNPRFGTIRSQS